MTALGPTTNPNLSFPVFSAVRASQNQVRHIIGVIERCLRIPCPSCVYSSSFGICLCCDISLPAFPRQSTSGFCLCAYRYRVSSVQSWSRTMPEYWCASVQFSYHSCVTVQILDQFATKSVSGQRTLSFLILLAQGDNRGPGNRCCPGTFDVLGVLFV